MLGIAYLSTIGVRIDSRWAGIQFFFISATNMNDIHDR